ncbi:hypothetical protein L202_06350 [Cryptococcus amylolentus CBS 6039]|uniref:Uncharacterized protein n=1 Tax=Cryptococcus amylolentus CBS 6039 TaxID=1295533 RepID=A0A1E3HG99_9TREE|nr:hypothetical protein L202_06350 [Cryptococcus amylolentus CBS 6039]ODN75145.1 hypothetical protein L202_06350 [Cryptococcus amylolentus CBS 6039]
MSNPLDQPVTDTPLASPSPSPPAATPTPAQEQEQKQETPLAIEDGSHQPADPQGEEVGEVHRLDLGGGNVVKLDKLGPMIINSDGTLSRIQNWQDLHPVEQERTVRLLVKKRNLVRLKNLNEAEQAAGGGGEELSALKDQA